ncbi:MAG: 2-oxo-acid dehydrogenase subunit, homodimeric type, partial [Proteobacteria bacterium]|nr:2-oxo-acid dehydrogenase subunit, homodimeric type [Pseudomonadota bacterium]
MEINRDLDPLETQEWLDALKAVEQHQGLERANFLVDKLVQEARRDGIYIPSSLNTAYRNTIPIDKEERTPGIRDIEHKIRSVVRWNAVATILRANKKSSELGGHIASFQSSALLYDIGFEHFWHGLDAEQGSDLIYFQG